MNTILRAEGITKHFGGIAALKGVSFELAEGEIHAICGENGAGKSTLIKVLSGVHPRGTYSGEIFLEGGKAAFSSIKDAERAGIAVIYQELALVGEMTVAENIFLGSEPVSGGLIDWDIVYRKAGELLAKFDIDIDPSDRIKDIGVGQQQLVEIVKALGKDSRILILDEPTAALTEEEVGILLDILRDLRAKGVSCIYISHKLDEVFSLADRVTVLRDGEAVASLPLEKTDRDQVIKFMVGREIKELFPRGETRKGDILLEVEGLTAAAAPGEKPVLRDISFRLRSGEVLGLGGLMGAGRTEALMHIFGAWGYRLSGKVRLFGEEVGLVTPGEMIDKGLVLVAEDRKRYGLFLDQSVGFNLSLSSLHGLSRGGFIDSEKEFEKNRDASGLLRIKAPDLETEVKSLSGGNQQKVVIGKSLMTGPRIIFLDEPTRGIDVGAKVEVYRLMNSLTASGHGVVMVSSEMPELIGMSDSVVMLSEGRVAGRFEGAEITQEKLLAAAIGH
ncbi:MAG: ATP-binding cassette domain-containing protein [Candidatus Omnitrophica bacterium]|nr:ATP-binding cassette domain-containing protein [Candidatus Omnitrophota bacterium]